jgi:hypothetical protein
VLRQSHVDVETKIQLVPNIVQSVPGDESYGSFDSTLAEIAAEANEHFVFYTVPHEEAEQS